MFAKRIPLTRQGVTFCGAFTSFSCLREHGFFLDPTPLGATLWPHAISKENIFGEYRNGKWQPKHNDSMFNSSLRSAFHACRLHIICNLWIDAFGVPFFFVSMGCVVFPMQILVFACFSYQFSLSIEIEITENALFQFRWKCSHNTCSVVVSLDCTYTTCKINIASVWAKFVSYDDNFLVYRLVCCFRGKGLRTAEQNHTILYK